MWTRLSAVTLAALALGAPALAKKSPPPLQGEAAAAAAGDIPDNQVFLVYRNTIDGYSLEVPEGWARSGRSGTVTFRDKNNIVRVVVSRGNVPGASALGRELAGLHTSGRPHAVKVGAGRALEVTYATVSAPNPVTGKRLKLSVDRYYVGGHGRYAVIDLGSPVGVDNVDAFRLISNSFRWR